MNDNSERDENNKKIAADFLRGFVKMLQGKADVCIHCGTPLDKLEQVGRCVYARPCGCRQYQGRVPGTGPADSEGDDDGY
jgi:uncharacterized Zn finger protein (UPF0148 family)